MIWIRVNSEKLRILRYSECSSQDLSDGFLHLSMGETSLWLKLLERCDLMPSELRKHHLERPLLFDQNKFLSSGTITPISYHSDLTQRASWHSFGHAFSISGSISQSFKSDTLFLVSTDISCPFFKIWLQ